ncbi:unnamed protein product [Acanthoscelides obtectus]|uniref:Uncharacterized protein n=1 Tax=Acanthoscelides obtectus TaxID=200917 RepID=A0A9P0Q9S7_ACAOB|nr:unnamed protein product [Acanthoscelides obtectus]CAK1659444.1 hypothetical protein AOBTE_LOCUS21455 [Acanthoscelides obtectus]
MVEIFNDILQHGRFYGIYLGNDVVFEFLEGGWFVDVDFAFQISPFPLREITRSPKKDCNRWILTSVVWHVAPSCWK